MSRREVERVVAMINYEKGRNLALVKSEIKEQVYDAYSIAESIYNLNKGKRTDKEIKKMIIDTIRPIRYNKGLGYYFIIALNGMEILFAGRPEMEGRNMLNIHDSEGHYVVRDMINLVKRKNEGFYSYFWTIPRKKGNNFRKISFVKFFKPYNWLIGTGFYLKDMENEIKKSLLARIGRIRFGKNRNGYIFVIGYDGTMLMHDPQRNLIGKNLWDITDPGGVKVVQLERRAVRNNRGAFIHYQWEKPSTGKISPKVTFIKGIEDWKWMVGSGVYLDDVERDILFLRSRLHREIQSKIINLILVTVVVVALFLFLFNWFANRIKKDFYLFISFFDRAAFSDRKIDRRFIKFSEFYKMANYANKMLENKVRAEHNLVNEKEQLAVTLRSIGDGVITTDRSGRVELINIVAEKLTGWKQEVAKGVMLPEIFRIIDKDTGKVLENHVERVSARGDKVDLQNNAVLISKNGDEYNIADSAAPIRDVNGKIKGVVLVFRDITEQIRAEKELSKIEKLRSMGIFAGGIAHDFNNILTGIFGNIELAVSQLEPDNKAVKYLETAQSAMERAKSLTRQFLTFAKGGDPIMEAVDIKDVIEKSVKFNLTGSNIKASINIPNDIAEIKADRGQISEVISNLTVNAKQSMPSGGIFYINAKNVKSDDIRFVTNMISGQLYDNYIKITLRDQGEGIAPQYIDKIFDPYFSTKKEGSGLGLTAAHSIIKKHNGFIKVESSSGAGTVFTIYLPALPCQKKNKILDKSSNVMDTVDITDSLMDNIPDILKEDGCMESRSSVKKRILIMDDEELIREVSEEMLDAMGYDVETCCNGTEALEKYANARNGIKPFDLVIMDLTVPGGMGGKDAVAKLLEMDTEAKVIVSSGYSTDSILTAYKSYGFNGRLLKPFDMELLRDEVERVLKNR